jgi:hypothetical protein
VQEYWASAIKPEKLATTKLKEVLSSSGLPAFSIRAWERDSKCGVSWFWF